jgi:hypothetical protein
MKTKNIEVFKNLINNYYILKFIVIIINLLLYSLKNKFYIFERKFQNLIKFE